MTASFLLCTWGRVAQEVRAEVLLPLVELIRAAADSSISDASAQDQRSLGSGDGRCSGAPLTPPACSFHSDGGPQCEEGGPLLPDRHAQLANVGAQRRGEGGLCHRGPHRRGQWPRVCVPMFPRRRSEGHWFHEQPPTG